MAYYKTLNEAMDIVEASNPNHWYVMVDDQTGEILRGTADEIAATVCVAEFFGRNTSYWPVDEEDREGSALMDTLYAAYDGKIKRYDFEQRALDIANKLIEVYDNKHK